MPAFVPDGQERCPRYSRRVSPPGTRLVCRAKPFPTKSCRACPTKCRTRLYSHRTGKAKDGHSLRAGSLTKQDLAKSKTGKIVSKRKSEASRRAYEADNSRLREWNMAASWALKHREGGGGSSYDAFDNDDELPPFSTSEPPDSSYVPFSPRQPKTYTKSGRPVYAPDLNKNGVYRMRGAASSRGHARRRSRRSKGARRRS